MYKNIICAKIKTQDCEAKSAETTVSSMAACNHGYHFEHVLSEASDWFDLGETNLMFCHRTDKNRIEYLVS